MVAHASEQGFAQRVDARLQHSLSRDDGALIRAAGLRWIADYTVQRSR